MYFPEGDDLPEIEEYGVHIFSEIRQDGELYHRDPRVFGRHRDEILVPLQDELKQENIAPLQGKVFLDYHASVPKKCRHDFMAFVPTMRLGKWQVIKP